MKTMQKGDVIHTSKNGKNVEVWVSSPTGDKSDSHIFVIPCLSEEQAEAVKDRWCDAWGLAVFKED